MWPVSQGGHYPVYHTLRSKNTETVTLQHVPPLRWNFIFSYSLNCLESYHITIPRCLREGEADHTFAISQSCVFTRMESI